MKKLGNRRVTGTEQYYTPKDLAAQLSKVVIDLVGTHRHFLEPAGGTGVFIDALNSLGVEQIESVDIHPKHPAVLNADFLKFTPDRQDLVCISNPPFGRNNALAVPFFNHAANFSDLIAFLVPRSWRKWSVINRLDQRFHLVEDIDVSVNYVSEFGEQFGLRNDLRSCFQVWEKRESPRGFIKVNDNRLIEKCPPADADIAIRVFGYGCGAVFRDFDRKPNTTLMFLRVLDRKVFNVIEGLDYSRFKNNTAYTQALALPEINFLLNEALFSDPMLRFEAYK